MATPLEKARKDPDSMKARILKVARQMLQMKREEYIESAKETLKFMLIPAFAT